MTLQNKNNYRTLPVVLLGLWVLLMIKLILFKDVEALRRTYEANTGLSPHEMAIERANLTLFKTCYYYLSGQEDFKTGLKNLGGNILLFIPYGFFLAAIKPALKPKKILGIIFLTSLAFELLQLALAYGNFDVDDLFLNVTGGSLGLIVYYILFKRKVKEEVKLKSS